MLRHLGCACFSFDELRLCSVSAKLPKHLDNSGEPRGPISCLGVTWGVPYRLKPIDDSRRGGNTAMAKADSSSLESPNPKSARELGRPRKRGHGLAW